MKAIITRIIGAIVTIFIIIISYGVISWNVFGVPTFLSSDRDCMPTVYSQINATVSKNKVASSLFREGSLFGGRCVTY